MIQKPGSGGRSLLSAHSSDFLDFHLFFYIEETIKYMSNTLNLFTQVIFKHCTAPIDIDII